MNSFDKIEKCREALHLLVKLRGLPELGKVYQEIIRHWGGDAGWSGFEWNYYKWLIFKRISTPTEMCGNNSFSVISRKFHEKITQFDSSITLNETQKYIKHMSKNND